MIVINKHSAKLKIWCVKMPNAPYSKRCASFEKMTKLDSIKSSKIKAICLFLEKRGEKISYFGQAWSKVEAHWVYFDCILNINELRKLFDSTNQLLIHENLDPRSGVEKGLIDNETGEGIMGKLK